MPRYYFNCVVGEVAAEDTEGTLLADLAAARQDAITLLGELARDELPVSARAPAIVVDVTDGSRRNVVSVCMAAGNLDG